MRIISLFFFLAFHCVCLFSSGNCKEGSIRDENPEYPKRKPETSSDHGRLITSKEEPVAYRAATDKLPSFFRENLDQRSTRPEISLKNRRAGSSPKDKHATLDEELPLTAFARAIATAFESNGQLSWRKLNRRSAAETKKEEQATRESGFPSGDGGRDQHSREQVDAGAFQGKEEGQWSNYGLRFDNNQRPFNLSDLLPFKNGFLEIVSLPGQVVKKILARLLHAVRLGPESRSESEESDNGLPRTLLENY